MAVTDGKLKVLNMEEKKLLVLQEKYDAIKAENESIFERELAGEKIDRQEWLNAKKRLEEAEKELNAQKLKVQELKGEIMTDDEIEQIWGNIHDTDDDNDVIIDNMAENLVY